MKELHGLLGSIRTTNVAMDPPTKLRKYYGFEYKGNNRCKIEGSGR